MTETKMIRYFIADVHLNEATPDITLNFTLFLQRLPNHCQLYILGDLFDYWIGDDAQTPLHVDIANQLKSLTLRAIQVFFIHGNRDFLLGKQYADACGMTILPELCTLDHNGTPILIMHGDILCSHDKSYQLFRKFMSNPVLQNIFLLFPLFIRKKIATRIRNHSMLRNKVKIESKMDVNQTTVDMLMKQHNVDVLIQGHTHKPGCYHFKINDTEVKRFVLGAWHDDGDYVIADQTIQLTAL